MPARPQTAHQVAEREGDPVDLGREGLGHHAHVQQVASIQLVFRLRLGPS
jgi:hypothetical protein